MRPGSRPRRLLLLPHDGPLERSPVPGTIAQRMLARSPVGAGVYSPEPEATGRM